MEHSLLIVILGDHYLRKADTFQTLETPKTVCLCTFTIRNLVEVDLILLSTKPNNLKEKEKEKESGGQCCLASIVLVLLHRFLYSNELSIIASQVFVN